MKRFIKLIILTSLGLIITFNISIIPQVQATKPAIILVKEGKQYYDTGQYSQAIQKLQQAANTYKLNGNLINQAQVYNWISLAYQQLGKWDLAEDNINQSFSLLDAAPKDNQQVRAQILNSQGRLKLMMGKPELSLETWEQAEKIAATVSPVMKIEAQLNSLSLLIENNQWQDAAILSQKIPEPLQNLPLSRPAVYAQVNLVKNLVCLQYKNSNCLIKKKSENLNKQHYQSNQKSKIKEIQLLNTAIKKAEELQDERAKSYALGNLGWLYEAIGETSVAQNYTQQALQISQKIQAPELDYQWFWQTGRLFKQQGNIEKATAAYLAAVDSIQLIRRDLVALSPDIRFDIRDEVETVYRQTVNSLLQPRVNTEITQENLRKARYVIESLQLAELDNFFGYACLKPKVEIDKIVDKENATAAVVYPIVLDQKLEIILKLPQQPELKHYTVAADKQQIEKTVAKLRKYLFDVSATTQVKNYSQQIYNWLIQPIQADLTNNKIETLVFVLDGSLRNIPMGVLYNKQEKKYLLQKYSIALTPGLQLVKPLPLRKVRLKALIAGVKEQRVIEGKEFPALPNLEREVAAIKSQISKNTALINQKFTRTNLQNQIKSLPFSVVHLATHGQFSSNSEETFIMTWDKLLKVDELDSLLRSSDKKSETIELLVLSACKTALGDNRAALGLAGVAVRAGARSTLATLWSVDDESTTNVMSEFYQELNRGINKAQALQNAQLKIFKTEKRPYFWAPYVLVGNWL